MSAQNGRLRPGMKGDSMKAITICSAMTAAMLCAGSVAAQTKAKAQNVPEIPYDSVPNFIKMPPGLYLGEAMGVATNSKGHFFVFTRSATTRLFEFDQTGTFVREIGEGNYGFEFAHFRACRPRMTTSGRSTRERTW